MIAYISGASGSRQVWTANSDGTSQRELAAGLPAPADPAFSPDGRQIAFTARPEGNVDVYVVSTIGGPPRRVTNHGDEDANPSWSQNGQWIYFSSNRTGQREVWRTRADGSGGDVQITRNGGWFSRESVDGTRLFYSKMGRSGVWAMALSNGAESLVEARAFGPGWDLVADRFYFVLFEAGTLSLLRLSLKSGKRDTVAQMERRSSGLALSISPDEKFALYPLVDHEVNDLMLIPNFR